MEGCRKPTARGNIILTEKADEWTKNKNKKTKKNEKKRKKKRRKTSGTILYRDQARKDGLDLKLAVRAWDDHLEAGVFFFSFFFFKKKR